MEWTYFQPVKILFGEGKINELKNECSGYENTVLICDKYIFESGGAKKYAELIGTDMIFSDISPNPDISEVDRCSEYIRKNKADGIVAIGGGSTIDLAKASSLAIDSISEYFGTGLKVPDEHLPLIAVPTTAGTGSEVTGVAVLTDRKTGKKIPINSNSFYPSVAIIDPKLTLSVPPHVTASTGIDVLCHAIEGYWSKGHQPICDALAVHAASLVLENLENAYYEPNNLDARTKLAEASVIAGLAFTLPKTTGCHACSFPLTTIYGIPHGEACALTLESFLKINGKDSRTVELTNKLGFETVSQFEVKILNLKKTIGLRTDLHDLSLSELQIIELVVKSHHPNLSNNPIEVTDEMLYKIYKKLSERCI